MNPESLQRHQKNSYYIFTPSYTKTSAGIKVLHWLCHYLNAKDERAYVCVYPPQEGQAVSSDLYTPLLTEKIIADDFQNKRCPIVVYPETINGNPFHAPFIVRYLLNFPGLLGGEKEIYDDFVLSYSQLIADSVERSDSTLFFPVSDPDLFKPIEGIERKGSCFYAHKYKCIHGQKTLPITDNSFEITRNEADSLTQPEVAQLLARSEVFYCYENSSLIIEAILCGCPVVLIDNPFFTELIAKHEYGIDGVAFDTHPESIEHARKTVHLAREKYLSLWSDVNKQLDNFIEKTQKEVKNYEYKEPIKIGFFMEKGKSNPVLKIYKQLILLQLKFYHAWERDNLLTALKKSVRDIIKPVKNQWAKKLAQKKIAANSSLP